MKTPLTDETTDSATPVRAPDGVPRAACVVQIYGGHPGRRYVIENTLTIGRDASNGVVVDLPDVSRQHARLINRGGGCFIIDLNSRNGTFVNDEEVHGEVPLANGHLVKLGGAIFKFIAGGDIEALYHEEIYRLTILDGLTGIHNKRYLLGFLEREMARAARHARPLSLALLDVDHFKKINDGHGHLAGDRVLQELAQVISKQTRMDELVARFGGEEFAFVLPETDLPEAIRFCERVRALVEKHEVVFDGRPIRTTASVGVTAMRPHYGVDDFMRVADEQLYEAKRSGRNRVVAGPASDG